MTESSGDLGIRTFAVKALISAVVIVGGVAGGIYTGLAMNRSSDQDPAGFDNFTYLEVGESFPNYEVWSTAAGKSVRLSDLTNNGPLLIVFERPDCGACRDMTRFWNKSVMAKLDPQIRVAVIYDDSDQDAISKLPAKMQLSNVYSCFMDRSAENKGDGITATPTVIGLGRQLEIRFIVSGFNRSVDAEFINDHLL